MPSPSHMPGRPQPQQMHRQMPPGSARQPQQPDRAQIRSARDQDTLRLVGMGKMFIQAAVPDSNIILEQDFSKFIPLFNRAEIKNMSEDDISVLANEYNGRFSMQHPIRILSTAFCDQTSAGAVYYEPDKKYHKLLFTIPPKFKPLRTLNELGEKFPALINAFFNSSTTDNPLDHRNAMYGQKIAEAMTRANPESDKARYMREVINAEETLRAMKNGESVPTPTSPSSSTKTPEASDSMSDVDIDW